MLDTPMSGALEQNIFYVNQIMKFGKFLAVFQAHPTDPNKTVVTAFMTLGIDAGVFDKKKDYEKVPVLRNLVPAEVLMGKSSFNAGKSISARPAAIRAQRNYDHRRNSRRQCGEVACGQVKSRLPAGNGTKSSSIGMAREIKSCSSIYWTSASSVGRFGSTP